MSTLQSQPDQVLAPCPFCGGEAEMMVGYHAQTDAKVGCVDCCSEGPLFGSNDHDGGDHTKEAAAAWNKRAAVGGEAVAWAHKDGMRILKDDGEGSLYLTSERQDEYGQTIPLYTSPPATVDVGVLRKALNDIREAVTQEPEDKLGYSQVDHGSGIPRAYSVRENILYTIDRRLAALIGKEV